MVDGRLTTIPDFNESYTASATANDYSDYGAMDAFSRAYLVGTPMVYSMRHGVAEVGLESPQYYKFNAVFFDGHAETA